MKRKHILEVWLDTLTVKDAYTLVDGKRIKPPRLNERHIRPTEKGLDRLVNDLKKEQ